MAARARKAANGENAAVQASGGTATTPGAVRGDGPAAAPAMVEAEIRETAYRFFVERGRVEGHALDDWLRAEAQVRQRSGAASTGRSAAVA